MLCHMSQRYDNIGVSVPKTYIQKWEKYCRHLGGYSLEVKGPCALLRVRRPYQAKLKELGLLFYKQCIQERGAMI